MKPPTGSTLTWLDRIVDHRIVDTLSQQLTLSQTHRGIVALGSRGSSTSLLAGALAVRTGRPVLLVVAHPDEADEALDDLQWFEGSHGPLISRRLAALEVLPGESAVSLDLLCQRLQAVEHLQASGARGQNPSGQPSVWVAPIQALMQAVPQPQMLAKLSLRVEAGQKMPIGQLLAWLVEAGYERIDAIEQPGHFASRGGIVDIYLPAGAVDGADGSDVQEGGGLIRLDFFGDQVDSISRIDPDTMGSGRTVESVRIIGASADQLQSDTDTTNFLSLLSEDTLVVMHEMVELSEQARGYYERLAHARGIYAPRSVFGLLTSRDHVQVNQYTPSVLSDEKAIQLPVDPLPTFDVNVSAALQCLADLAALPQGSKQRSAAKQDDELPKAKVVVLCQKAAERDRLLELMDQHADRVMNRIQVDVGYLHRGFVWRDDDDATSLFLIPHHELFHRYELRRRVRRMGSGSARHGGRASDAFLEMVVGDYVVHADHGIARFEGLRTMRRKNRTEEFLTLQFAGNAHLYVPATQVDLVQKYVGGFQGQPPLSQLGGKRWSRQKQQVAEAVKDLAAELLRVQAARASLPGINYPADTPWQSQFEAEFPYEETEDQIAAIAEVKKDMDTGRPMDRLICGDVGFGKTEIAIRAAFKAAQHGKQVAVLVPTTLLAEQHERTFRQRMVDYPVRVESISRLKTGAAITRVLGGLAQGQVDVIIGTHRLLSSDVKFADLGLVIIDEEQRFGVEHKQTLMQLRLTVDVLTLSATPIPRTLHMSMLGLRDISSLTTPPLDRRAIVTEVIPFDAARIQQAIIRELNRDGQIYFVHNRVHSIQQTADQIQALVPEARVAVGHGQMPGHELEQVMLQMMRREIDVLVCTTIIESGIDIPTANTMFISGADRFGLADLHQLRGRVGRYKHRAYCYLLLPTDRPVTDVAAKRLRAIEQYAMLGAGFKIAMRDLEIRGAGNLLGPQQSGHIAAVGYEMYCQLLEQAANRLRSHSPVEPPRTHLELPVSGRLPKRYIGSDKYRIEAYRRISRATTLTELEGVAKDITDAYSKPPAPARVLLDLAEIRIAAAHLGVSLIKLDGPDVIFHVSQPNRVTDVLREAPGRTSVIDQESVYWRPPPAYLEPMTLLAVLRKVLVSHMNAEAARSDR